ncbi:MAG: DUF2238 domain-containing protein [Planctomycetia bacterium]|nr:DUF2238 domain-containing protein [Planctomycetia bacterium]
MNRYQAFLIFLLCVTTGASCVGSAYPHELWLQHTPTVLAILALAILPRRWPLSNAAVTCLVAFLLLHVLGARYIYSNVPYDDWCQTLLGFRPTERFHWSRNHYDRLVHFCFGALWILPSWEVSTRYLGVPRRAAFFYALTMVLSMSLLYELGEWWLTMVVSPQDADSYNGQQGDMWDAQKDMAMALLGGCVAVGGMVVGRYFAGRNNVSN